MDTNLQHGMDIPQNLGSRARARFVSGLRSYVLNNMASELRQDYEANVEPKWLESEGAQPVNGWEVLKAIRGSEYFIGDSWRDIFAASMRLDEA